MNSQVRTYKNEARNDIVFVPRRFYRLAFGIKQRNDFGDIIIDLKKNEKGGPHGWPFLFLDYAAVGSKSSDVASHKPKNNKTTPIPNRKYLIGSDIVFFNNTTHNASSAIAMPLTIQGIVYRE